MCFSYEASRNNFIINIITSYILYNYKNKSIYKILGISFGYVGIMQLFDMIFWSTQNIKDQSQKNINYVTTKIAMFVNHSQPIVFAYIIYYFQGKLGLLSLLSLIFYILVISIYTYYVYYKINYTLVQDMQIDWLDKQKKPILKWEWTEKQPYAYFVYTIFLLTTIILSYENLPNPFNIIVSCIGIITILFSFHYFKDLYMGRFWCKITAFVPLIFIIINYIKNLKALKAFKKLKN